jgi:hypothetical protein
MFFRGNSSGIWDPVVIAARERRECEFDRRGEARLAGMCERVCVGVGASDDDWRELLAVLARERAELRKEN